MEENDNKKNLNSGIALLDTSNFEYTVEALEKLANYVIKTELTPLATTSEAISAILTGREVGLPPMVSLRQVYPIQGRSSLGIHAMVGIALQNNITIKIIKDYEQLFVYYKNKNKVSKETVELLGDSAMIVNSEDLKEESMKKLLIEKAKKESKTIIMKVFLNDYHTVVEASRFRKLPNGEIREIFATGEYFYSTAVKAGLVKGKTGAWDVNPKNQMQVRAKSNALQNIADDLMQGMYNTQSTLDFQGKIYDVDDDNIVTKVYSEEELEENTVTDITNYQTK